MKRDYTCEPWSGLAPAVDAHLARWDKLHRVQQDAKLMERSLHERIPNDRLEQAMNTVVMKAWVGFAMSYGTVDAEGKPTQQLVTMEGTTISGRERFQSNDTAMIMASKFALHEYEMLDKAITHYVSHEVVAEINDAVTQAKCDPLWETDLLARNGFAVLEEPFYINDLHPDTGITTDYLWIAIRAFGWRYTDTILSGDPADLTKGQGIELFLYTTPEDYERTYLASLEDAGLDHESLHRHSNRNDNDFMIIEVIPWMFGRQWDINDEETVEHIPGFLPPAVAYQRRWFHTFCRFCWQQIIAPQVHMPKRPQQRRWEHMAKRKERLDYTVLRLRRVIDPNHVAYEGGGGVPLDHRVRVRPHPRNQYFPSLGPARLPDGRMNPASHRIIWIESHWRGPEDAPLGAMHSATSVVR